MMATAVVGLAWGSAVAISLLRVLLLPHAK